MDGQRLQVEYKTEIRAFNLANAILLEMADRNMKGAVDIVHDQEIIFFEAGE